MDCALNYVGGILEFKRFDFRGLKDLFDVEKVNFRGSIAKSGHYRTIFASRTYL